MRHTESAVRAAIAMLALRKDQKHWGYQLKKATGLPSGVLYPIMQRWVDAYWVHAWRESLEDTPGDRAPRRYIAFTPDGRDAMAKWVKQASTDPRFSHLFVAQREAG